MGEVREAIYQALRAHVPDGTGYCSCWWQADYRLEADSVDQHAAHVADVISSLPDIQAMLRVLQEPVRLSVLDTALGAVEVPVSRAGVEVGSESIEGAGSQGEGDSQ